ncbi:MAG: hypothetical protein R2761_15905 [Acidimicrobiales bacterium]
MRSPRPTLAALAAAALAVAGLLAASCGSDATSSDTTAAPSSSSTDVDTTVTTEGTEPTDPGDPSSPGSILVPGEEVAAAADRVTGFLDALGAGDIEQAATFVGPVSEQRAEAAGGLESLLRQSVEGHGAWSAAADRTVTGVAIDRGLVAVQLEGTLSVEGQTEHRVEVFPVRRAESAGAWFVEPWAYDVAAGSPIEIVSPPVDDEERATTDPSTPLAVTVRPATDGTLVVVFDAVAPVSTDVTAGEPATATAPTAGTSSVIVVLRSDTDVAARGFVTGAGDERPTEPAAYAEAAFTAWRQGDQTRLRRLATDPAYAVLEDRPPSPNDNWSTPATCEGAAGSTYCQWVGTGETLTLRIGNEAAATGQVALAEARFEPT